MKYGRPIPFSASIGGVATAVRAGQCRLHSWQIVNNTGALAYVQVFNKLQANVTLGTTPPDYVIPLPANGGAVMPYNDTGIEHDTGITIACTTTRNNNTGATCDILMDIR